VLFRFDHLSARTVNPLSSASKIKNRYLFFTRAISFLPSHLPLPFDLSSRNPASKMLKESIHGAEYSLS
jgi:hypothetical protein